MKQEEDIMIEITPESVRAGLKALVGEKGEDFVYSKRTGGASCRYVWNGEPDCIIGQLLARAGVPVERLARADAGLGQTASSLLEGLEREGLVAVSDESVFLDLNRVQSRQDDDCTWGYAIEVLDTKE